MEKKKNKKADLESKRGLFFLTGLVVALMAAIYIIQIESASLLITEKEGAVATADLGEPIPRTKLAKPEVKQEQKKQSKSSKKINLDKLEQILQMDDTTFVFDGGEKGVEDFGEGPVEIGVPDEPAETIPTGSIGVLSRVAVPMECADIRDNQQRKDCLNEWVVHYIRQEAKFPDIMRSMSDGERIYISFMVDEYGKVIDVKSVRGENELLVNEALRVVKSMPDFDPARQGAKKARMTMTVPVNFKRY